MNPAIRYVVTFLAGDGDRLGRSPTARLKGVLKIALRGFGLRCIELRQIDGDGQSTATGAGKGRFDEV